MNVTKYIGTRFKQMDPGVQSNMNCSGDQIFKDCKKEKIDLHAFSYEGRLL